MSKKKLTTAVPFHEQPITPQTSVPAIDPPSNDGGHKTISYRVLKGLSYYDNKARGEVGDVVTDLPAESISWLLEQGCIELASEVK
jgi:hypothetical protein